MKKTILLSMCMLFILASAKGQNSTQLIDNAVRGTSIGQHNYIGAGWVHASNYPAFHSGTFSYSNVTGAYLYLTFSGTSIVWRTEKLNTHGIVAVSIDQGPTTLVDLYAPSRTWGNVYQSPVLSQGQHTIKIEVTGTKNPASTGFYLLHDVFEITPLATGTEITSTFSGVGSGANQNLSQSNNNTGFGYRTLQNEGVQTPGRFNTAVGSSTIVSAAGQYNTAIGFSSFTTGGTSNGNTAVGAYALQTDIYKIKVPHGDYNTAVGYGSGPTVSTQYLTNTTALGHGAHVTASDQVRIGNALVTSIGGQVSWSTLSDGRFKRDIKEDVSGLAFINKLRPVSYTVDNKAVREFVGGRDSTDNSRSEAKVNMTRQTGFVAQEVDALVRKSGYVFNGVDAPKNDKDPYTIRYAEFVVPLVKAVQELSAMNEQLRKENEEQQQQLDQLLAKLDNKNAGVGVSSTAISLLQNNPNPFSTNTEIEMVLPESVVTATIIIYNLEGKQLKEFKVSNRGKASVIIQGNELNAGMYIYALLADGKVIDTKRMILTK